MFLGFSACLSFSNLCYCMLPDKYNGIGGEILNMSAGSQKAGQMDKKPLPRFVNRIDS
jgi:hypothetical protein